MTVLDCGWAAEDLLGSRGWLGDLARTLSTVVLVARPTLPGLRRAEITLALVGAERAHLVLVGMHPRRWPRTVDRAAGPLTRRLRAAGRITCLPFHAGLAVTGVTSEPLPVGVLRAARSLFVVLEGALP
ncbi:MAG: hypothetical protein LCH76_13995 [Actinobacteria bacterium]|nr:hypothetical protein [Actinomycetota bacterium]